RSIFGAGYTDAIAGSGPESRVERRSDFRRRDRRADLAGEEGLNRRGVDFIEERERLIEIRCAVETAITGAVLEPLLAYQQGLRSRQHVAQSSAWQGVEVDFGHGRPVALLVSVDEGCADVAILARLRSKTVEG